MAEKNMFFTEEDRLKKVIVDGDEFTILALLPNDQNVIERMVARMQFGVPTDLYSREGRYRFEMFATIQMAVKSGPPDWEGPESWPIQETIEELYEKIQEHTTEFQAWLKKNRRRSGG